MQVDWERFLSDKVAHRLEPSLIGEMMKLVKELGAISFTAGEPSADLYPLEELRASFDRAFSEPSLFAYYPHNGGLLELRRWIVDWMKKDGLAPSWLTTREVLLTNGSQEGIHLIAEAFIEEGDAIIVESPTYPEALLTFRRQGARFLSVPVDREGIVPEALEALLEKSGPVKFIYSIVNFQNPSGYSTTDERKAKILDLARRYDTIIVEDDPYRYLRYEGRPQGSYFALDGDGGRVLYLGSFSKIILPGVRVGWLAVPPELAPKMTELRVSCEISLPAITQYAVWDFMKDRDLPSYLATIHDAYRTRRDALASALREECGPLGLEIDVPEGGFFLWGRIAWLDDVVSFARYAITEEKIGFIPGSIFFADEADGRGTVRFSFAKVSPDLAREGAKRLARAMKAYRSSMAGS